MLQELKQSGMPLEWLKQLKTGSKAQLTNNIKAALATRVNDQEPLMVQITTNLVPRNQLPVEALQATLAITASAFESVTTQYLQALVDLPLLPVTTITANNRQWQIPFLGDADQASIEGVFEVAITTFLTDILSERLNIEIKTDNTSYIINRDQLITMMDNNEHRGQLGLVKAMADQDETVISLPIVRGPWIGQEQTWFQEGINAWHAGQTPCILQTRTSPNFQAVFPQTAFIVETLSGQMFVAKIEQKNMDMTLQFLSGNIFTFVNQALGLKAKQPIKNSQLVAAGKTELKFKAIAPYHFLMTI